MDDVMKAQVLSAIRTLLGVLAGVLIGKGITDEATATAVIGAVTTLLPLIWGVVEKNATEQKTQAREAIALSAGIASATGASAPMIAPEDAAKIISATIERDKVTP